MIFPCCVPNCTSHFATANDLLEHVADIHKLPAEYSYRCSYPNCIQIFSNIYSFKRHLKNHKFDTPELASGSGFSHKNIPASDPTLVIDSERITSNEECQSDSNNLRTSALELTLRLHQKSNFSRQDVTEIQKFVQQFCSTAAENIENMNVQILETEKKFQYHKYLRELKDAFKFIDSDYKFMEYLKNLNVYQEPSILLLDNDLVKKVITEEARKSCLVLNPIEFQIRSFFETNDILKKTLDYTAKLEQSPDIQHFVNGSLWKQIKSKYSQNDYNYVLPIWLYADEFEVNDPQSSHSKVDSICGIYFNFPTLPAEHRSKLWNIFVGGFIRKVVISRTGVNKLVDMLLVPFQKLEDEGITFQLESRQVRVCFVLCLFQGDNLGVHTLLQLSSGFNANFYCRFCRRHRTQLQSDDKEYVEFLRNVENYKEDLLIDKHSVTGISGPSSFNQLKSFHVIENPSVDVMHDMFSNGICKYGFTAALNYFILKKHWLTIEMLNTRIHAIAKSLTDSSLRKIPDFELAREKQKGKTVTVRMTAAEMKSFCKNFTLILGPFITDFNDSVWTFCKTLVEIGDLISTSTCSEIAIPTLKSKIELHHKLYQQLFQDSLKPKHHFLVHYPEIIKKCGPIEGMSCIRNEAKHQKFKEYAHVITSRKNIAYTLCVKSCLQFSHNLYFKSFFTTEEENKFSFQTLNSRPYMKNIRGRFPFDENETIAFANTIKYEGVYYTTGHFLTITEDTELKLLEIEEFVKHNEDMYAICRDWKIGHFSDHLLAYEALGRKGVMSIINMIITDGQTLNVSEVNNKYYFRLR